MTERESEHGIVIEPSGGKVNIVLDMSMFDLFSLCPARYNYRHNLLKAPTIARKSKALDMGSLAHEGLEVYFKMLRDGAKFDDRMDAALRKIKATAADPEISNSEPDEVDEILKAVEQSCDYWRFEDEHLEILEVEQAFAYVIYEDDYVRIIVTGKIDVLMNKNTPGQASYLNLPMDHKTYSRDFEVPRLSNQFHNYCYAVQSNYIIVNRIGLQKTKTADEKFKRIPLSYDNLMFEDWKQNIINTVLEDYLTCLSTGHWKMRFTSCFSWNRKCEYYEICEASGPEAKVSKLESAFATVSPWDVSAKLNKS